MKLLRLFFFAIPIYSTNSLLASDSPGSGDVVIDMFEVEYDVDYIFEDGMTQLHKAALVGDEREVLRLISLGANTSLLDSQGFTALDIARNYGHRFIVQVLEERSNHIIIEMEERRAPILLPRNVGNDVIIEIEEERVHQTEILNPQPTSISLVAPLLIFSSWLSSKF